MKSTEMHNQNCHAYLQKLLKAMPDFIRKFFPDELAGVLQRIKNESYNSEPRIIYGNVYSSLFVLLEKNLGNIEQSAETEKQKQQLNHFFFAIYHNDNHILNSVYNNYLKPLANNTTPKKGSNETRITRQLKKTASGSQRSANHPVKTGNLWQQLSSNFGDYNKAQYRTNIPSIRHYKYQGENSPIEYRFGTQGQRHHNDYRTNPLFERWLKAQKEQHPAKKITHVYINNLRRDGLTPPALLSEQDITKQLEGLEGRHDNIAVITLPADGGLMAEKYYKSTEASLDYRDVFDEFLAIALEDPKHSRKIKDFHISAKIRGLLFAGKDREIISRLITDSFAELDIKVGARLSRSERQAIWFHFCKFKLTDYILTTLQPVSVNFSCKDAIDRGGVSSAYYNLLKSFSTDRPMTQDEFNEALLAAPTLVKGRGINHHLKRLWNTIDGYVNAHYKELRQDEGKSWLIHWRDMNCPHSRVRQLIERRIEQNTKELQQAEHIDAGKKKLALEILEKAKKLNQEEVSGQRLLLEVVSRTPNLLLGPEDRSNLERFQILQKKFELNYPALYVLAGLMKTFLGAVICVLTAGSCTSVLNKGLATTKTGFFARTRKGIIKEMEEISNSIESAEEELSPDDHEDDLTATVL